MIITKCSECPECNPNYSRTGLYCAEMLRFGEAKRIDNIDIKPLWCPLPNKDNHIALSKES